MCPHLTFRATVSVGRILQNDGDKFAAAFVADVKVSCVDCDEPFEFYGCQIGWSAMYPTTNFPGDEIHIPLKPKNTPMPLAEKLLSYRVEQVK